MWRAKKKPPVFEGDFGWIVLGSQEPAGGTPVFFEGYSSAAAPEMISVSSVVIWA